MKKILSLIIIFVLGFLVSMIYHGELFSFKKYNIPKTSFKIINDEHYDMFKLLDEFYKHCKDHWETEEKIFEEGKKKIPESHVNVDPLWEEHNNEHKKFIKRIEVMKEDIIKHIEQYDRPHFHFSNML